MPKAPVNSVRDSAPPGDRHPLADGARAVNRLAQQYERVTTMARDALPIGILAIAMIFVPVFIFEPQGLPRLRSLERDLEQVEAENRAAEHEIARLRANVKLLKGDLATVEKVARQELGLIRKSEIVLQLPKAP